MDNGIVEISDKYSKKLFIFCQREPWDKRSNDVSDLIVNSVSKELDYSYDDTLKLFFSNNLLEGVYDKLIEFFTFDTFFDNINDNLVAAYISKNKYRIFKDELEFLNSIRKQNYSIFKIVDCVEGEYVMLKDIILNTAPVRINDEILSIQWKKGNYLYTKILKYRNEFFISKLSFYIEDDEFLEETLEKAIEILKKYNINFEELSKFELVPEHLWEQVKIAMSELRYIIYLPGILPLCMADFDNLDYKTLSYKVSNSENVANILNSLTDYFQVRDDDENVWDFYEKDEDGEDIDIASVELIEDELFCSSWIKNAIDKLQPVLEEKLGANITLIEEEDDDDFDF